MRLLMIQVSPLMNIVCCAGFGRVIGEHVCNNLFDNFFSSPTPIRKLYDNELHDIGTVRKDRKYMPSLKADKELKRGDTQMFYYNNVMGVQVDEQQASAYDFVSCC